MARLGDMLVEYGAISDEQLTFALRSQRERGGRLGTILVELGFLTESALAKALSVHLHLPSVSAAAIEAVPREALRLLPADNASHYRACPVRLDGNQLWMAMSDPSDQHAIAELDAVTRLVVRPMVCSDLLISYALEKHYNIAPRRRPSDYLVSPHLDLPVEPYEPFRPGATLANPARNLANTAAAGPAGPAATVDKPVLPVPFPDQFSAADRALIDARLRDLDEPVSQTERLGPTSLGTRLVAAGSQREIFDTALAYLAQDFQRLVVLVIRNGRLAGFRTHGDGVDEQALLDFSAGAQEIAVIAKALKDGKPRLGKASAQTFGSLTRALGPTSDRAVVVVPARCAGEPIGCIVGVDGRSGVESYVDEYVELGNKLDYALQLMVLRKRIME